MYRCIYVVLLITSKTRSAENQSAPIRLPTPFPLRRNRCTASDRSKTLEAARNRSIGADCPESIEIVLPAAHRNRYIGTACRPSIEIAPPKASQCSQHDQQMTPEVTSLTSRIMKFQLRISIRSLT